MHAISKLRRGAVLRFVESVNKMNRSGERNLAARQSDLPNKRNGVIYADPPSPTMEGMVYVCCRRVQMSSICLNLMALKLSKILVLASTSTARQRAEAAR